MIGSSVPEAADSGISYIDKPGKRLTAKRRFEDCHR